LKPFNIFYEERFRASQAIVMLITIRSDGESSHALFEPVIFVVATIMRPARRSWGDDTKVRKLSGSRSYGDARALSNSS